MTINVGFPINEDAAKFEKYATLIIDGYEAKLAMTGVSVIINALNDGINPSSLSSYIVRDMISALEVLHKRMWEICECDDKA